MAGADYRTVAVMPANLAATRRTLIRTEAHSRHGHHAHAAHECDVRELMLAVPSQHDAVTARLTDLAFPIQIMQAAAMQGRITTLTFGAGDGEHSLVESVSPIDAVAALGSGGAGSNADASPDEEHALGEAQHAETLELAFDPSEMILDQMIADLAREHQQIATVSLASYRSLLDDSDAGETTAAPVRQTAKNWFARLAGRT